MGLTDLARRDIIQIMSNTDTGWAVEMTLIAPPPINTQLVVKGLHTKTHLGVSTEGEMVDSKKAHVSFTESQLTEAAYPCRNTNGDLNLKDHHVKVKDSTGIEYEYVINQWFPDEQLGLIICILNDFVNA